MRRDYRTFIFANLAFGPAIGFATLCLPMVVFVVSKNWQGLQSWQNLPSAVAGLLIPFSFALVFGMVPAFINFGLMMPLIKTASRRTLLCVSPVTGYLATAAAMALSRSTFNLGMWEAILTPALLGIVPAVCCTLIAFRLQDRKEGAN